MKLDDYYYFTVASNFAEGYDKYSRTYRKNSKHSYPDKFFLCTARDLEPGLIKAENLLQKVGKTEDRIIAIRTHQSQVETERGYPVVRSSTIQVDEVSMIERSMIRRVLPEDVYSLSLKLNQSLRSWNQVTPRTFSVLPIAKGCQARCPFCFSHGSISADQISISKYDGQLSMYIQRAQSQGVKRAVITGGGEPTMISHENLLRLISACSVFPTVVLITNGYKYAMMNDEERYRHLKELETAGLTVLAISRHGITNEQNSKIMYLQIESEKVAITAKKLNKLKVRWICVLQKGGVEDRSSLEAYLKWVETTGVQEICFKELYVSTSYESVYHDTASNDYCRKNQVPLSLIIDH